MRMGNVGAGIVTGALALTLADVERRNATRAARAQAISDANAVAAVEELGYELAASIRRETAARNALAQRDAENLALRAQLAEAENLIRRLTAALQ